MRTIASILYFGLLSTVGCGGEPCFQTSAEQVPVGTAEDREQSATEVCMPDDFSEDTRQAQGVRCTPCAKVGESSCGKCGARKREWYYWKVCWMEGSESPAYNVHCYTTCKPCY